MEKCKICKVELIVFGDPRFGLHPDSDCGGDCLACVDGAVPGVDGHEGIVMRTRKLAFQEAADIFARRGLYGDELLAHWAKTGKIT